VQVLFQTPLHEYDLLLALEPSAAPSLGRPRPSHTLERMVRVRAYLPFPPPFPLPPLIPGPGCELARGFQSRRQTRQGNQGPREASRARAPLSSTTYRVSQIRLGHFAAVYHDPMEGDKICIAWKPETFRPRKLKVRVAAVLAWLVC
jgi:hypothetical protein